MTVRLPFRAGGGEAFRPPPGPAVSRRPATRDIARRLYATVADLPIVSPHGHTDPAWFAENPPFPDPARLFIVPDHYVHRMLYSQGIAPEDGRRAAARRRPGRDGSAQDLAAVRRELSLCSAARRRGCG